MLRAIKRATPYRFQSNGVSRAELENLPFFSPPLESGKETAKLEKSKKKTENQAAHGGVETHHEKQLPRLSRIEGQVRGLQKMIETERNCLDICHQISAIINALRRVQTDMVREHLAALGEAIVAEDISPKKRREMADELTALLKELS
jgi:CsoR family transcriptional regulator, copper-sensing transcriptional repressor